MFTIILKPNVGEHGAYGIAIASETENDQMLNLTSQYVQNQPNWWNNGGIYQLLYQVSRYKVHDVLNNSD